MPSIQKHIHLKSLSILFPVLCILLVFGSGCSKKVVQIEAYEPPPPLVESRSLPSTTIETEQGKGMQRSQEQSKKLNSDAYQIQDELEEIESVSDAEKPPENGIPQSPALRKEEPPVQSPKKPTRMVAYTGSITSRSSKPDSLVDIAVRLTESVKGFIEYRNNTTVTLRVPSAQFQTVYDSLLKLGEIIDFRKSAEDITDAFRDSDLRIQLLERTIERYTRLVKLVKSETEKINLLKEIETLREELELLKIQKSVLVKRADYATIYFSVQQRATGYTAESTLYDRGFSWIAGLDPFGFQQYHYQSIPGKRLNLDIPAGMVHVKRRKTWMAQSPGGTCTWTGRIHNDPAGTSRFWIDAIRFRMKDQFMTVDTGTVANYHFIRFTPHPGSNYIYTVFLSATGKNINIVQIYFAGSEQEQRYLDAIKKVIAGERAS